MESIDIKISRPIHGEAGPFALRTESDGSLKLRVTGLASPILVGDGDMPEHDGKNAELNFTAAEFEVLGTLLARFRKARGRTAKPGAKKTTRKRTTKPAATAPEPPAAAANGESY